MAIDTPSALGIEGPPRVAGFDSTETVMKTAGLVWNPISLAWDKMTQPGGGGGGGGAVTVADGADVAEGATTDAANTTGAAGTISGKLRGLVTILADVWDSVNHRFRVDGSGVTQPVSAAALPLPAGAATEATLALRTKPADQQHTILDTAIPAGANNIGGVNVIALPAVAGGKTNNNAAPGATNIGALPALANAAIPAWTEGNLVAESVDLAGAQRVVLRPDVVLGAYSVAGSVGHTATTANGIIFSFRWGDATRKCRIIRVAVAVIATAFTTAGLVARKMVIVRGFTVSDTGGTSVLPAANQNKLQTAFPTSLLTDARFGGFLTAGTGTADTNPVAIVPGWMAAVGNVIGGANLVSLYEHKQGKKALVFAQNEGFRVQLDAVETASTRQTFVIVEWDEGNNFE